MAGRNISKSHEVRHSKSRRRAKVLRAPELPNRRWRVSVNIRLQRETVDKKLLVSAPTEEVATAVGMLTVLNGSPDIAVAYFNGDWSGGAHAVPA